MKCERCQDRHVTGVWLLEGAGGTRGRPQGTSPSQESRQLGPPAALGAFLGVPEPLLFKASGPRLRTLHNDNCQISFHVMP